MKDAHPFTRSQRSVKLGNTVLPSAVKDAHRPTRSQLKAAEVELLSARKLGEMLAATVKRGGDPKSHDVTLTDLGIAKMHSSRWQQLAAVPRDAFDDYGLDGLGIWAYTTG